MAERAWLVDTSIYIFRAWFSMPDRWYSPAGQPLSAVVGYTGFLFGLLERVGSGARLAAAFDESLGTCFRHRIDPGYKASRVLPDEALAFQLAACRELTALLGLPCYGGPEFEADDYLATLARTGREAGQGVSLVSRDKDLGQLLGPGDELWDPAGETRLDAAGFRERFGVEPRQFPDYQALVGDRIDDIPGVPGVGPRTAAALLGHFPDLEAVEASLTRVAELPLRGARRLQERLQTHWPRVLLSRDLARLETRVPGVRCAPPWRPEPETLAEVAVYLQSLGIGGRLLERCRGLGVEVAA